MHVKNLSVKKDGRTIFTSISFEIKSGSLVAVLGLNGVGKTSLAQGIMGLIPSESETLELDGISLQDLKPHERAKAGIIYVPEGKELFLNMSVLENLEIGFLVNPVGDSKQNISYVFEIFPKLLVLKDQKAETLSGGEQQMLCIGRALMASPRLLILDEPSQGLAPLIFKSILKTLQDLKNKGMRIILIEQYAEEALKISDSSLVLGEK